MCMTEEDERDKSNNNRNKKRSHGRSRTKTRKPKYLSLSKQLEKPSPEKDFTKMTQQLNLFPLHPELINDRSFADHHENVALLFDSEAAAGDETLTGILRPSPELERSPSSYERTYDSESLVRAAMKRRRNDNDNDLEEKWVCYSEVVEEVTSSSSKNAVVFERRSKKNKKRKSSNKVETMSSNSEDNSVISATSSSSTTSLALKLDYEGILNAWSDKGSLYIQPHQNLSSLQTVPDLLHCDHHGLMEGGWGSSVGNLWKVPENDDIKIKEEPERWKLGQREASVLRYKEKRQNRLFSKKIRYQVRKLNAEKRPRMKGRFVKTC